MLNNNNKHDASSVKSSFVMILLFHALTVQGEQRPHSLSELPFNKRSRISYSYNYVPRRFKSTLKLNFTLNISGH
jgi:hypothetical protein